jgi:hypothetical protein
MRDGIRETRLGSRTSTGGREVLCVALPALTTTDGSLMMRFVPILRLVPMFLFSYHCGQLFFPARRAFIGTNRKILSVCVSPLLQPI